MTTTLYTATTNPGKLREFAQTAANAGAFSIEPLPGLPGLPVPDETASTFRGNADLKAVAYSLHAPGMLVLADDSGLEVDALGGRPGVLSARFADSLGFEPGGAQTKDERNNRCVLSLLVDLERAGGGRIMRGAHFVCALSLARDGEVLLRAEGNLDGDLAEAPRGSNGFGYDALFVLRNRGRTLAELEPADKWTISHRGKAIRALLEQLPGAGLGFVGAR